MIKIPKRYNSTDNPVFEIKQIECSYGKEKTVLKAQNICIPRGKVTVLLGPSGAGKSTLLESLGLMTQTITPKTSEVIFYPEKGSKGYPLQELWEENFMELRYKIRQDHYSFIFQSTNLMPNFTAIENVSLTELIQSQETESAVYNAIKTIADDLSVTSLNFNKLPFAFSGGERQRIAFARAVNPEFSVLFGDEPTGNLDHFNSNKLMRFIRNFILEHDNKSALIVSHNIDLALDFADRIIILTSNSKDDNCASAIHDEFILDRGTMGWENDSTIKERTKKEIELLLNNDTSFVINALNTIRNQDCPLNTYLRIKDLIIDWSILKENKEVDENDLTTIKNKVFQYLDEINFREEIDEKEFIIEPLNDFFDDNTIENNQAEVIRSVIDEVDNAELKNSLQNRFNQDYPKKTLLPEIANETKNAWNKIYRFIGDLLNLFFSLKPIQFILSLLISLVPWTNIILEVILSGLKKGALFISGFFRKNTKPTNNNKPKKKPWKRINNWIRRRFIKTCLRADISLAAFETNKRKVKNIKFKSGQGKEYASLEIIPSEIVNTPIRFKKLFYKRESEELLGINNKNLWLVFLILFLTFLAIGFSSGSLEYLEMKMRDPFISSVTANIPSTSLDYRRATRIIDQINQDDSLKELYKIDTITYYNTRTIHLTGDKENSPKLGIDGRTIPLNDPMIPTIVDSHINDAIGEGFINDQDYSIISTMEMLKKLNCTEQPSFLFREIELENELYSIPIPISAIVRSLPGYKTNFLITPSFYQHLQNLGETFLFDAGDMRLFSLIVIDSNDVDEFENIVIDFFKNEPNGIIINDDPIIEPFQYSYKSMYRLIVAFENYQELSLSEIKALFAQLKNSEEMQRFLKKAAITDTDFVQAYSPDFSSNKKWKQYYLSANFSDLDKVENFAGFIKNHANIKLEMSNIERIKNYNFVSKLTMMISVLLIFFSVLMINLFLSNILRTHLNKIVMNIGTFKAFGIDIQHIYQKLMFMYILLPLIAALFLCAVFGYSWLVYHFMQLITNFEIEKNLYFNLINFWTLGSLIVLLIVNYFTFSRIIQSIFIKKPGDLIYDRSNKA